MPDPKYKCKVCGKPVYDPPTKGTNMCRRCYNDDRIERNKEKWRRENIEHPHFCIVCGKQFEWTPQKAHTHVKTCSSRCAGLASWQKRHAQSETVEEQIERVHQAIRDYGKFMPGYIIAQRCHVDFSKLGLLGQHGITHVQLNADVGYYKTMNTKTREEVIEGYKELIKAKRGIRKAEALRLLDISDPYLKKLGIRPKDLRKDVGIYYSTTKTKEELEAMILEWLKKQPCYYPASGIAIALDLDPSLIRHVHHIDGEKLNAMAGHVYHGASAIEKLAHQYLYDAGLNPVSQKTYPDLRDRGRLRYDFWIPEYNVLIEIDGRQHRGPSWGTHNYERDMQHDRMKDEYAAAHNIPLFRVYELPHKTYKKRLLDLIEHIKGLPRVNEEVHTDSNCGELPPGNAEDNPQPSLEDEPWDVQPDLGF